MIKLSRTTGRVSGGSKYTYIDGTYVLVRDDNYVIDTEAISAVDYFGFAEFYTGPLIEMVD